MERYIYLMRHGNPGQDGDPKRCLGSTDVSVSKHGRYQIEKSKNFIRNFKWKHVYSSPMKRCIETAECLGISEEDRIIREDLREMAAGIWENLTFSEIKEKYPDLYEARGKNLGTFAVEGAESFKEAGERFAKCLDEIRKETDENVLVISHAGVIRGFLCAMMGKNEDDVMTLSVPYGSITVVKETDGRLELMENGLRPAELLDEEERKRIYIKCNTPSKVIAHMEMVAETAMNIMNGLEERGQLSEAGKDLVYKAALLHDILRTEKHHAVKSAAFLRKEGYKDVADIVALHHSGKINESDRITLDEILFYADKLVQDDKIVTIEERFAKSFQKCAGIPEAEEKHQKLFEKAKRIEEKRKM